MEETNKDKFGRGKRKRLEHTCTRHTFEYVSIKEIKTSNQKPSTFLLFKYLFWVHNALPACMCMHPVYAEWPGDQKIAPLSPGIRVASGCSLLSEHWTLNPSPWPQQQAL